SQSAKKAALIGFAWGLGQFGTGIYWVHVSIDSFGGMPKIASIFLMTLLISYLSIYPALFAGLLNRFFKPNNPTKQGNKRRLLIAAPILWLICDWLRGWVLTGFPWLWLGYSQIDSPLNGFAPVSGVEAITLAILMIAGSLVSLIQTKKWRYLGVPVFLFGLSYLFNQVAWVKPDPETKTSFALIQGNIPQHLKWQPNQQWPTLMKYTDLTRENWGADIIIWPEAAIPAIESQLPAFLTNIDSAARQNDSALITGVINQTEMGAFYNSVISLGDNAQGAYNYETQPRYHKHHLLPFGEFVPLEDLLRPLAPFFNLPMSSFSRGGFVQKNIEAKGRHLAAALCYEIIFSEQVRQNITDDTDFILTLSNDAWFGKSIGPLQHFEIARMRALELGKPLIRSTNNGVTGVADYQGKVIKKIPQFETGVLSVEVESTQGNTPYRYLGSNLLYIWVAFGFLFNFLYQRKARKQLKDFQ
ncbi:MAG: apolipoprotein N-acyltransferase, partial [Vibrio sp.]